MDTITLTDLFFIVTGIAVIFITAFIVIALIYFIMFLRTLKAIADQASRAGKFIVDDLGELSKNIKQEGFKLGSFLKFIFRMKSKVKQAKGKK